MVDVVTVTLNPAIDHTITIPGFIRGAVNRVQGSRLDAGGKGVNVAAALADDSVSVAATGFLGAENQALFRSLFTAKGIADHFVRIAGPTRTGIKIVDPLAAQTTDVNFPGQTPTPADIATLLRVVDELTTESTWFVLAGSVPATVPAEIYRHLVGHLKSLGKCVALDTSGVPLELAIGAGADLVKPNQAELAQLVGRRLDDVEAVLHAARQISVAHGIASVVVSMGRAGAVFVEGPDALLAVPSDVDVCTTVGAGDALLAGIVAQKLRRQSLEPCARWATACAMGAVSRVGAGLPLPDVLARHATAVSLRRLS